MDKELFLMVYKSLIRSVFEYGSPVWNPSTEKYSQLLENVQRRATKLVPELKTLSYQERLSELNLPTLNYRRNRYDLIQLFKIIAHIEDTDMEKFGLKFKDDKTNSTNLYPSTKGYLRETCKSQNINPIYLTLSLPSVLFRS